VDDGRRKNGLSRQVASSSVVISSNQRIVISSGAKGRATRRFAKSRNLLFIFEVLTTRITRNKKAPDVSGANYL
jgi:hypothetical protein